MLELSVLFRALQLVAHAAHNFSSGATFQEDHAFFGDIYGKSEGYYDSIIERMIGFGYESKLQLQPYMAQVLSKISCPPVGARNEEYFKQILNYCTEASVMIDDLCSDPKAPEGVKQLLGGIADELDVLKYKLQRRLK